MYKLSTNRRIEVLGRKNSWEWWVELLRLSNEGAKVKMSFTHAEMVNDESLWIISLKKKIQ